MTPEEIQRHLMVGRDRAVCVDITLLPDYPVIVRSVVIRQGGIVDVRFDLHGYDEGGRYYRGRFTTLKEAIAALEIYLRRPIEQWENFTSSGHYPDEPEELPTQETWDRLLSNLAASTDLLPKWEDFRLING